LGVELSYQFREPPVGKPSTPRLQGFPHPLAVVNTIDMEGATALFVTSSSTDQMMAHWLMLNEIWKSKTEIPAILSSIREGKMIPA
jgi:hypothetical protein